MTAEIFKEWSNEEIHDYQEIGNKKLEPFYVHVIKKICSRNYASQFQTWSREKIQEYQSTINNELEPIYAAKEIPSSDPKSRIKYITNVLEKVGYNFKKQTVNYIAIREGKAKALVLLESAFLVEKSLWKKVAIKMGKVKSLPFFEKAFLVEKSEFDKFIQR